MNAKKQEDKIAISVEGNIGSGKCVHENTPIILADGTEKRAADVVVGDFILGDDNTPRKVLDITRGEAEMFHVKLIKGESHYLTRNHILVLQLDTEVEGIRVGQRLRLRWYGERGIETEYFSLSKYKTAHKAWEELNARKAEIGSVITVEITVGDFISADREWAKRCRFYTHTYNGWEESAINLPHEVKGEENPSTPVEEAIVYGNYLMKRIGGPSTGEFADITPLSRCMANSFKVRQTLLQTIIDTIPMKETGWELISTNESLMKGLFHIAHSIGISTTFSRTPVDVVPTKYRLNFKTHVRTADPKRYVTYPIEYFRCIGSQPYVGFEVDGNNRFLLSDFTVTHNSTLSSMCLKPELEKLGLKVVEVPEPVDYWVDSGRLKMFYEDPSRRGFHFQIVAFDSRLTAFERAIEENPDADVFIIDRSIFADPLFMRVLHTDGTVDTPEYEDYIKLWQRWSRLLPIIPSLFVYLRISPDDCMERLRKRNRKEEVGVSIDYLQKLHEVHEEEFEDPSVAMEKYGIECLHLFNQGDYRNCDLMRHDLAKPVIEHVKSKLGLE